MIKEQLKAYKTYCLKNGLKPQDYKNLKAYTRGKGDKMKLEELYRWRKDGNKMILLQCEHKQFAKETNAFFHGNAICNTQTSAYIQYDKMHDFSKYLYKQSPKQIQNIIQDNPQEQYIIYKFFTSKPTRRVLGWLLTSNDNKQIIKIVCDGGNYNKRLSAIDNATAIILKQ